MGEFTAANQTTDAAFEKARLIADALDALRVAKEIDERESLDRESWVAWYDATIPQVRDIKILAGAMEIELHRRRGEQQPSRGPGRPTRAETLTRVVRVSDAAHKQLSRDRVLAAQPARVSMYIQHEAVAGRVPSVHGAMRAVKTLSLTDRKRGGFRTGQENARRTVDECLGSLTAVADGTRRTDDQLLPMVGDVTIFLQRVRFLPWLTIDRTAAGTVFVIDHDLRAICDGRAPRPAIGKSIRAYLLDLRAEITRRRKENHDEFRKRNWNSELILKREQTSLLDWIEEQLNQVPN